MARKNPKAIVFPEGEEEITLRALEGILEERLAHPILIGNPRKIKKLAGKFNLKINFKLVRIEDPKTSKLIPSYTKTLYELRRNKGVSIETAEKLIREDINYFGTMILHSGLAHGMVTGTICPTSHSIKPPLQIIKTREKFHKVSGVFFMALKKRLLLFADAVLNVDPNSHDLADIAIDSAETAKKFGIKPKVALLSFSSLGSAEHPVIDKVREAVKIIRYKRPDILVEGELQADAALIPSIAKKKCPNSKIRGDANILVFPNLESANIGYKLVERLAQGEAIGPLIQGLNKPVNDISRGCDYKDLIDITAFTVCS